MNRRLVLGLLVTLAVCFFLNSRGGAAPLEANQTLKLPCGRTVKVLSISRVEYSKGVMALLVRYQTNLSMDERKELSVEVDDVWHCSQKDVERLGYHEAIISSNEVPKGIILHASRMLNFIFEKGADGQWTRLNRAEDMAAQ